MTAMTTRARLAANIQEPEEAGVCPYCRGPEHTSTHFATEPCSLVERLLGTLRDDTEGVQRIATERHRQIEAEGWTLEHDIEHGSETLQRAAVCYLRHHDLPHPPYGWPWASKWWKPCDRIRALEKAGALIAAALDVELELRDRDQASRVEALDVEYGV